MVAVAKKENVLVCVDLRALNKALLRENYSMQTLEDVAPYLADASFL